MFLQSKNQLCTIIYLRNAIESINRNNKESVSSVNINSTNKSDNSPMITQKTSFWSSIWQTIGYDV